MKQILCFLIYGVAYICPAQSQNGSLEKQLDALFSNVLSNEVPGGSILVKKADEIVFLKSYGVSDMTTKEKITENTIFNTGSISKTFVANGILILKEKGLLSLEDKLSVYFDDFDNPEIAEQVNIKHLLSHTSGLPDIRRVRNNRDFYLTAKDKENFEPLKRTKHLNFRPGEQFQYSNPAYNGLALIIEKLANQPWQDFIEESIFKPSAMSDSKITNGSYPESGVAHAYVKNDRGQYIESDYGEVPTFAAAGNGGVWCSVLDLAKYAAAIQQNVFLSEKLIQESQRAFVTENWSASSNPSVGYSWFTGEQNLFRSQTDFNVNFVYHTGSQGGFRAFYVTIPEKDILFIGLFNRPVKEISQLIKESVTLFKLSHWIE